MSRKHAAYLRPSFTFDCLNCVFGHYVKNYIQFCLHGLECGLHFLNSKIIILQLLKAIGVCNSLKVYYNRSKKVTLPLRENLIRIQTHPLRIFSSYSSSLRTSPSYLCCFGF